MVRDCYHRTREFALDFMGRWGIETTLIDADQLAAAIRPITRLIFAETPTNPYLRVVDLSAMVELARQHGTLTLLDSTQHGTLTLLDSTFATPINLRPLEHGIDLVMHSATARPSTWAGTTICWLVSLSAPEKSWPPSNTRAG